MIETAIILFIAATLAIGIRTYVKIGGQATNYYVAGNSMPAWVIGITLCAQAFDANGSVGNASLSFSDGFWAGAAIPIGLAACLFITGFFFAKPIHRMHLMTLPGSLPHMPVLLPELGSMDSAYSVFPLNKFAVTNPDGA